MHIRFLALILIAAFFIGCENTDSNESPYFLGYSKSADNINLGGVILDDSATAAGALTAEVTAKFTIDFADDGKGEFGDNIASIEAGAEFGGATVSDSGITGTVTMTVGEAEDITGVSTGEFNEGTIGITRQIELEVKAKGVDSAFTTGTISIVITLTDGGTPVTKTFIVTVTMASAA